MILCVCKYGHSRSVAATRLLHRHKREAIACGWHTNPRLLPLLCGMADTIVALDKAAALQIPFEHIDKTILCDVGADKWRNPYDDELIELLKPMIENVVQSLNPDNDRRFTADDTEIYKGDYRVLYCIGFAVGFVCALIWFTLSLLLHTEVDSMSEPMVEFSCENLKRNRRYKVKLKGSTREIVGYFDTLIRNVKGGKAGKALHCVFTEKRNGKGNILIVATSVEIESAVDLNPKEAERE